jgi:ABC-type multidrug transport system permease subunit
MLNAIFQIMAMQFREFYREPAILFWSFGFPILIAASLGIAFTQEQESNATVAVATRDKAAYQSLLNRIDSLPGIQFEQVNQDAALQMIRQGKARLYLTRDPEKQGWQAHYDPKNSEAQRLFLRIENQLLSDAKTSPISTKAITTIGNRYIDFLIPGLIALGIMNSCLWGLGWALIEFRIKKLLRRMIATPLPKSTFLFSLSLTRVLLASLEAVIVFLFAYFLFGVVVKGSWLAALLCLVCGIAAFSGISILISSRAEHTQVGNGLINAVSLPMIILSGIFFSYQSFPEWAVDVIRFLPLTLLADSLRAVFIESASLADVGFKLLALLGYGFLFFVTGLKVYKWH